MLLLLILLICHHNLGYFFGGRGMLFIMGLYRYILQLLLLKLCMLLARLKPIFVKNVLKAFNYYFLFVCMSSFSFIFSRMFSFWVFLSSKLFIVDHVLSISFLYLIVCPLDQIPSFKT